MDTLSQGSPVGTAKAKNRRRTINIHLAREGIFFERGLYHPTQSHNMKERRDIVEETLVSGASVARVARKHEVNANQVFYWRKLFREGRLGISMNPQLLPVKVEAERPAEAVKSVQAARTYSNVG